MNIMEFIVMPKGYGRVSKEIRDYITNLQQENEETKEVNENLLRYVSELILYIDDYKSRCEKASELLQKYGNGTFDDDLLNILQNGSEDNE